MNPTEAIVLVSILIVSLFAWQKAGFKCPIYIHIIAGFATALGGFIVTNIESNAPVNHWWLLGKWWIILIMLVCVYGGFAIYGSAIYSATDQARQMRANALHQAEKSSKANPLKQLTAAYRAIYAVGILSIFLGTLAIVFVAKELEGVILGTLFLAFGGLYLLLGYFVQRQSKIALGIAVALMLLNLIAGLYIAILNEL